MSTLNLNDLSGIQGDILLNGFPKKAEIFCFFTIRATQAFCQNIQSVASSKIATGKDIKDLREQISKLPKGKIVDVAKTNIAFTATGLTKLSNSQSSLQRDLNKLKEAAPSFSGGMQDTKERNELGDPVFSGWNLNQNGGGSIDGVLLVAGPNVDTVEAELKTVLKQLNVGGEVVVELFREVGKEREKQPGHEHFGFNDGISHPQVFGIDDSLKFKLDNVIQADDTSNFIEPGVIIVGRRGDGGSKPQWMNDGSFLVFRKLEQHVGKWNDFVFNKWKDAGSKNAAQFGAQLMGRWQSGCPIHLRDDEDVRKFALRNDFDYGGMEKQGKCPLAAHIRKANIRIPQKIARIMRRGIPYGEDFQNGGPDTGRGLLFACYQSNIEDGYGFIQKSWANVPDFPSRGAGLDVTIGQMQASDPATPFQIGTKSVNINPVNDFVTAKGGEYFFAPSMAVLKAGFNVGNLQAKL